MFFRKTFSKTMIFRRLVGKWKIFSKSIETELSTYSIPATASGDRRKIPAMTPATGQIPAGLPATTPATGQIPAGLPATVSGDN